VVSVWGHGGSVISNLSIKASYASSVISHTKDLLETKSDMFLFYEQSIPRIMFAFFLFQQAR